MENQNLTPSHHLDASRPSLGFPLGTALLLIVIFGLSGVFSCCYHWEKLRSLRRSFSQDTTDADEDTLQQPPSKSKPTSMSSKQNQNESLPVLMPGDQIPKFIALPCPCEPPREEMVAIVVQKPPPIVVPFYYN